MACLTPPNVECQPADLVFLQPKG
ncbi:hypothetical protein DFAR_420002 [Desulfarculales bacterium]